MSIIGISAVVLSPEISSRCSETMEGRSHQLTVTAAVDENFTKLYNCSDHLAVRLTIERLTCSKKTTSKTSEASGQPTLSAYLTIFTRTLFTHLFFQH